MLPIPRVIPKKVGIPGPSMKAKRVSSSSASSSSAPMTFNAEERAELKKLSSMLPPTPKSNDPNQVVIQAATYIHQLMATVQARVNNGTLPKEALSALPPGFASIRSRRNQTNQKKRRSVEKKR